MGHRKGAYVRTSFLSGDQQNEKFARQTNWAGKCVLGKEGQTVPRQRALRASYDKGRTSGWPLPGAKGRV